VTTFDLTLLPLYRQNGQAYADLPGLLALTPPRRTARGRERDSLVLYLMLSGNTTIPPTEIEALARRAADLFYQTPGSLTSAMRRVTETLNAALLERNLSTSGRGQYVLASLILAVIRENLCTLSLSGPVHVVWVTEGSQRHIHEPALSGKGLGSSQSAPLYFSQIEFRAGDLMALCGKFPKDWEADLLYERPPASLEAAYRKLTFTKSDLHAALIQPQPGRGTITILRPTPNASSSSPAPAPAIQAETPPQASPSPSPAAETAGAQAPAISEAQLDALAEIGAHLIQASAYTIPPSTEETPPAAPPQFPPSLPRRQTAEPAASPAAAATEVSPEPQANRPPRLRLFPPANPDAHAQAARQMAKVVVGGIRSGRRLNERLRDFLRRFIPRLLPGAETAQPLTIPNSVMVFIAIFIPLAVSVVAWLVYSNYGLNETYRELYQQALLENAQAASETDPVRQRDAYLRVLERASQAEQYRETDEIRLLRNDAQNKLDSLMGIIRLEFIPAFTNGLGRTVQISRMAASESDLYMLNAENSAILHASFNGRSLEYDAAFNCQPGTHGGIQVGTLVDILPLPKANAYGASVLGIDTNGALLYCTPGQIPRASTLPALPNLNWGRITAFTLDNDNLYILDAETRSVWVYRGKNGAFNESPYFFFSNQIPDISTAIDIAVSGDDLYLLHTDGHLSTCTYSRLSEVPTRCIDPAPRIDNYPAHRDLDIFAQAHITQLALTNPPNPIILLLDAENRSVFRLTPRSLELQNQVTGYAGKANPFQPGAASAMTISPNYVLYLAIGNQVYFAVNLP
jgi:hypothetical protein